MFPALSTLNWLVPPTCASMRSDPVAEAVFVGLMSNAASTTPVVFHVGVIDKAATVCEPVSELPTESGIEVDPAKVETASSMSPVPVAAVVSPNVKAVWLFDVCAQFQTCAPWFPLAIVFAPVAAATELSATELTEIVLHPNPVPEVQISAFVAPEQLGMPSAVGDAELPVPLPTTVLAVLPARPVRGRPVALVSVNAEGVPRFGVVIAQLVVKHSDPVPL